MATDDRHNCADQDDKGQRNLLGKWYAIEVQPGVDPFVFDSISGASPITKFPVSSFRGTVGFLATEDKTYGVSVAKVTPEAVTQ